MFPCLKLVICSAVCIPILIPAITGFPSCTSWWTPPACLKQNVSCCPAAEKSWWCAIYNRVLFVRREWQNKKDGIKGQKKAAAFF